MMFHHAFNSYMRHAFPKVGLHSPFGCFLPAALRGMMAERQSNAQEALLETVILQSSAALILLCIL